MRAILIGCVGVAVLGALLWGFSRLGQTPAPSPAPELSLSQIGWSDLVGWAEADPTPALSAFQRSCKRLINRPSERLMGGSNAYGTVADWRAVCTAALDFSPTDGAEARAFFIERFVPVAVADGHNATGLFTGYYEPELKGSLVRGADYQTPLLKRPDDLVMVQLGDFRPHLKGERIAGRIVDGTLKPFENRAEIEAGKLDVEALAWIADPVDAFFLHIQGSGRVRLGDGSALRVGYAGQNGHPYTAIGRTLIDMGALERGSVSMQTIRSWLSANPAQASEVMHSNASYIFFREIDVADLALGPLGAESVALTPGYSLAVDRNFHALGVPVWLDATFPTDDAGTPGAPLQRLMVAQDTGGAIRGPVRGDVFFGFGEEATRLAGWMKQKGQFFVLLPKPLAARLSAEGH